MEFVFGVWTEPHETLKTLDHELLTCKWTQKHAMQQTKIQPFVTS